MSFIICKKLIICQIYFVKISYRRKNEGSKSIDVEFLNKNNK